MNKLIKKIGIDKILHFLVGGWIYASSGSLLVVALIGILKEMFDEKDYGGFDLIDFLYTIGGGFVMYLIITLL
tara:strand:- start:3201 stop:3419 length:219 start_codon:yes stop_codon:yes gene_type:complete